MSNSEETGAIGSGPTSEPQPGRRDERFASRMIYVIRLAGGPGQLARKSGLSHRIIDKYKSGESDPSRRRLIRLARAADVSVAWLAAGELPVHTPQRLEEFIGDEPARSAPGEVPKIPTFDPKLMADCIVAVEELSAELGREMTIDKKAELMTVVYLNEMHEKSHGKSGLSGSAIIRLFRRLT